MLYKLTNNIPIPFTKKYIQYNGRIYANPTNKQLKIAGYKSLISAERPEDEDGYIWVEKFTENEDNIIQEWIKEAISYDFRNN